MPVPDQREIHVWARTVEAWLAGKLENAEQITVGDVLTPKGVGNSNETILFTLRWREDGEPRIRKLVARIAPSGFQVMLEPRFLESMLVQRALAESGRVPVPRVLWSEEDPEILGAPFYVMEHVKGKVPTDNPPYNAPGSWLHDLAPQERERLWHSAMRSFCALHRQDFDKELDLPLRRPSPGSSGLEAELEYWTRFIHWAGDGRAHPLAAIARDWLIDNMPGNLPTAFAWGDPRIENMMFGADLRCVAMLDWELASLSGPLSDLGWWLFMDEQACASGGGNPRLEGLGDRQRTLELWREETGLSTDGIEWYEIFSGYKNIACITRIINLMTSAGRTLPATFSQMDNVTLRVLRKLIDAPALDSYEDVVAF